MPGLAGDFEARLRGAALQDLRWHWEDAYAITVDDDGWHAERLDNHEVITRATAAAMRRALIFDYAKNPVSRRHGGGE